MIPAPVFSRSSLMVSTADMILPFLNPYVQDRRGEGLRKCLQCPTPERSRPAEPAARLQQIFSCYGSRKACLWGLLMRRLLRTVGEDHPRGRRSGLRFCVPRMIGRLFGLRLLLKSPAFQHGVRNLAGDQPNGPDRIVIAWDDVIDFIRIAVGIDDR